jgi:hypothetical protein
MIFFLIDSRIIKQSPSGRANVARMGDLFNLPIDPLLDEAGSKFHRVPRDRRLVEQPEGRGAAMR